MFEPCLHTVLITYLVYCNAAAVTTPPQKHDPSLLFRVVKDDRARIIGGSSVLPGELKYQLSLRYLGIHHCGASLIQVEGVQLAVTAAHCVSRFQPDEVSLVAGETRLSVKSGLEQVRQVTKIVNHEQFTYNLSLFSYDIGLLFMDTPFLLNDYVGPIALPRQSQESKGNMLVSGWGVYNADGFISDNLTKLEIPIVDYATCKKTYAALVKEFSSHFLCAGFIETGVNKDTCKGDSGGPLRSVDEGYLAGVISWGAGCGTKFPGVNTKVSFFSNWITDQVKKNKGDESKEDESDEDNLS